MRKRQVEDRSLRVSLVVAETIAGLGHHKMVAMAELVIKIGETCHL